MTLVDIVLSLLEITTAILFFVLMEIVYEWMNTPPNLPPGPPGLPIVGNVISLMRAGPNILDLLKKWRQQYGDLFTLKLGGQYLIVISSYKVLQETFVKNGGDFSCRPTYLYAMRRLIAQTGSGVMRSNGRVWKEQRRLVHLSLRSHGVGRTSLEQRVQEEARTVTEVLDRGQGQSVSVKPLLGKFSANIICSVVLGKRFGYDDAFLLELIHLIYDAMSQDVVMTPVNTVPLIRYLPPFREEVDKFVNTFLAVDEFLETTLREHEETYDSSDVRDFVDLYIKTREESNDTSVYNALNLRRVIMDMLIAGIDTSATALEWIILYLIAFPDVQKRCQQDADKVIGQGRLPMMADRTNLPYIQAVITETLRIVTVAPLIIPHSNQREATLCGYAVPTNSIVAPNIAEIHHDPDLWPEPHDFKPERFLDKDGQFCPPKDNYVPFSIGPRLCVGESLAQMELFMMVTTLVQSFTFTMAQGRKPDLEGHLGVLYSAKPQPVFATRR